jgi:hypothetical protein
MNIVVNFQTIKGTYQAQVNQKPLNEKILVCLENLLRTLCPSMKITYNFKIKYKNIVKKEKEYLLVTIRVHSYINFTTKHLKKEKEYLLVTIRVHSYINFTTKHLKKNANNC